MSHAIALWEYALWGSFGGVAVEAVEILGAVKRTKGLPWNQQGEATLGALLFTILVRLGLGAGLAVALGEAGQISGGVGAIAAGVAAPLILEQMGKQLHTEEVKIKDKYSVNIDDSRMVSIGDNQLHDSRFQRRDDSPSPTPEPSPPPTPEPSPPLSPSPSSGPIPPRSPSPASFPAQPSKTRSPTPSPTAQTWSPHRSSPPRSMPRSMGRYKNSRRRKEQGRLGRLTREVAFGLTRSTPAFGGTAKL